MSQQSVLLKAAGLYTFPNRLSTVPPGALLVANNIVINRDNIVESRRGYKLYGTAIDDIITNTAHQLLNYKGRILRHWGTGPGQYLEYDSDALGTFLKFSLSLTATTTNGASGVGGFISTSQLTVGMYVSGTGIPANTTILSITNNNTIIISNNATASNVGISLTFTYNIQETVQGLRIKSIEQNGNLYFTTSEGIKKISSLNASNLGSSTITSAGGIKALDLKVSINSNPGFLIANGVVAYRILWGIKDNNQNLILGAPSERVIISNSDSSNSKTVDLKITIPRGITSDYFFQIYRTATFSSVNTFTITGDTHSNTTIDNIADTSALIEGMSISGTDIPGNTTIVSIASSTSIIISNAATASTPGETLTITQVLVDLDPGDEEGLVYENNPTSTDLNNGYVSTTDVTPDSFRGANLYTNANSGEGILQANTPPPFAKDITSFKSYTFYANTKTNQQLNLSLLSVSQFVSGTSSLTITDGTTTNTYTFKTTPITGDTHSTTTIDNIADTSILTQGLSISGVDIDPGTYIVSIIDANSIEVSKATLATNAGSSIVAATENVSAKQVALSQFATPGQQVDETARSLVRIINSESSELVNAYYLSGVGDVPGSILLEARDLNTSAFYLNVDDATTTGIEFTPNLPSSGNSIISNDEVNPNRIYYSKFQQPEAVPTLNYVDVGPKDKQILRILALRDNLFILKEEGLYRLSGLTAPFQIYPFDFSTNLKAPDSAVVLNNLIYCVTNQGVATVSDTGVQIISRPIEGDLIKLATPQYTNFVSSTFGVSYESDRAYYLFTLSSIGDTYATQCFRFNTFTNTWTNFDISKRCGIVNSSDDKLYLGATDVNYIEQERKSFDRTDLSDRELSLSIPDSSISSTNIGLSSLTNISINDVLVQTQYLTISQFNQILTKLDRDSLLFPHNYFSNLQCFSGDNLSTKLDSLINQIANDVGRNSVSGATSAITYTNLSPTPSDFISQQSTFNSLVGLLNTDLGVNYLNYTTSSGNIFYELPILSLNKVTTSIVSDYSYPLISGPVTVYNHISTEVQFVPQYLSDVSVSKQVSEGTFIFEDSSFSKATVSYASDLSANFEDTTINGNGSGLFGNLIYGNGLYGGNGSGVPFRTLIPREKQRCRYLNVNFKHFVAREVYYLYGVSLTFIPTSHRAWR